MDSAFPRRYKAQYASSMGREIRKNVQLEPGEEIHYSASVQARTNWLLMRPGILELTSRRLILLEHHPFSADWILEIPRPAVVNRTAPENSGSDWASISFSNGGSVETLKLRPFALRGRPSPADSGMLLEALRAFQSGELTRKVVEKSEKHHEAAAGPPSYSGFAWFALFCLVLLARVGMYAVHLPAAWHAKQAYDASPDCNEARLIADAALDRSDPELAKAPTSLPANSFCTIQPMTVFRIGSERRAPYQLVGLADSRGQMHDDVGALNSVDTQAWLQMRRGETVYVLMAGEKPAWILHGADLFETRGNPDHSFWEQSLLMLAAMLIFGLFTALALYVLRSTILGRRHAALATQTSSA
jgi:hypothetical protein